MASRSLEEYAYDRAVASMADHLGEDGAASLGAILERSRRESEERLRRHADRMVRNYTAFWGVLFTAAIAVIAIVVPIS